MRLKSMPLAVRGKLPLTARKIWERARFRLIALGRPRATLRRHRALGGRLIVVYTMGKVGSSSVYYTLMKSFPFRRIYHNHFLSEEWVEHRLPGTPFSRNVRLARAALAAIRRSKRPIHYIVIMRDPIGRDLSNVIQNHVQNGINVHHNNLTKVMAQIREQGHKFCEEWFNTEFVGHIGQALGTFPFDRVKGYAIHRIDDHGRLLLLTVESMDRVFDRAMAEFLGVAIEPQYRFNESAEKAEGQFYEALKANYRLPPADLDQIYSSPVVRHFYGPEEVLRFRSRWEAP